jgi:regulator of telomere elongation helicase 1
MGERRAAMGSGANIGTVQEPKLSLLKKLLELVFSGKTLAQSAANCAEYKVYVCEGDQREGKVKKRTINYWAFSPGIAMKELKRLGVRSIILTSGTLSPLDSFQQDMKLPFQIRLENPHVITDSQLWVGAISAGPNAKNLNSSYSNRDTVEYKNELGASVLSICSTLYGSHEDNMGNIDGGMLLFFSGSY